ncbi:DUF4188 domain-containing protein [Fictibacillus phosphorivorans]|uniref:DUF4188 domain-containing protein n=1 Tax=Fictibacillus phosphorivorans TaxID=1221500 RepID=UPI00203BC195|nr:DUF4188 domain-containing protein [Fictibacillus phosphorivorans]MCM3716931.1 DUF4188 domain-containing protein [Fictibacillus phosphorivorans]MCM3774520.1 DUF4188 domain-containing protein [Fictibacillus phosphorivorans]
MKINKGRFTAEVEDDFVLFIIGMRINKFFSFHKWIPVLRAMGPMIKELYRNPQLGFLHTELLISWRTVTLIQYWRSFDQLEAYAHGKTHLGAWKDFNKKIGNDGTVGIFHESYRIAKNDTESIYSNMPRFGLGKAQSLALVTKKTNSARERINK